MRLDQETDPCVVWAWGCAQGPIWEQAEIEGQPDPRWQWLTINKGSSYGMKKGLYLQLLRDNRQIAVAEIDKVTDKFTVAWILKGTMCIEDRPQLGDEVRILA